MPTLARSIYLDSELGAVQDLPRAGTSLEIPAVYDDIARELKELALAGLIEVVTENVRSSAGGLLIDHFAFRRLR